MRIILCLILIFGFILKQEIKDRVPANSNFDSKVYPVKEYSSEDAVKMGLKALQEQKEVKERLEVLKDKGEAVVKELESAVKGTVYEIPAVVLVTGVQFAIDKKLEVKTGIGMGDQRAKMTLRPEGLFMGFEGNDFLFLEGLKYDISSDVKNTKLNIKMDF